MNTILTLARKYVSEVQKSGIPVSCAYLFGSYAKGSSRPYSDIDICIVSPLLGRDFIDEVVKLGMITPKVDERIEVIPFSEERLNDPYDPLAAEIRRWGILLR